MIETGEHEECDDNNVDYSNMYQQSSRLATYILMYNHVSTPFDPLKFAEKGLFYNQRYHVIICFSCRKKTPTKFKIILPGPDYKKSNFHFEECKLDGNKPINVPDSDTYELIQIHLHREYCVGFSQLPPATNVPTSTSSTLRTDVQTSPTPLKQQKPSSQQHTEYDSADKRLMTFTNWPQNCPVRPLPIAEAGFVYLGTSDKVQCVYCQGILSQWEPDDDPIEEHFKHFSSCVFILRMITKHKASLTRTSNAIEVTSNRRSGNENSSPRASASNHSNSTSSSKYETLSSRIQTFSEWIHPTLTATQLSLAGFYIDENQKCKCFRCHVTINDWQVDDDPLKVHATKSPNCSYIIQLTGRKFMPDPAKSCELTSVRDRGVVMPGRESAVLDRNSDKPSNFNIEVLDIPDIKETEYLSSIADALKDENEKLKDEKMCIVCMNEPKTTLILPCAHLACCSTCIVSLKNCPVCRTKIRGTVKTFLP